MLWDWRNRVKALGFRAAIGLTGGNTSGGCVSQFLVLGSGCLFIVWV